MYPGGLHVPRSPDPLPLLPRVCTTTPVRHWVQNPGLEQLGSLLTGRWNIKLEKVAGQSRTCSAPSYAETEVDGSRVSSQPGLHSKTISQNELQSAQIELKRVVYTHNSSAQKAKLKILLWGW